MTKTLMQILLLVVAMATKKLRKPLQTFGFHLILLSEIAILLVLLPLILRKI